MGVILKQQQRQWFQVTGLYLKLSQDTAYGLNSSIVGITACNPVGNNGDGLMALKIPGDGTFTSR